MSEQSNALQFLVVYLGAFSWGVAAKSVEMSMAFYFGVSMLITGVLYISHRVLR